MSISTEKLATIEKLAPRLVRLSESEIDQLVESGDVLSHAEFAATVDHPYGQFYAPFDWINEGADIVLIGITPGRRQAKAAIKSLRASLAKGRSATEAAEIAKQSASFEGDMREIAAKLMDRFGLHELFRLTTCADLFGNARRRAHYTSVLRYPILHWQTKKPKNRPAVSGWFDYSGGEGALKTDMLSRSIRADFEPEIVSLGKAWLVPFGPVPATALQNLAERGLIDRERILPGINHPSGTQHNRHKCQLNTTNDHSECKSNVGCDTIRSRSIKLEKIVAERVRILA